MTHSERIEQLARAASFLFVPATKPERIDKALSSGADWVIADLEDAVSPEDKDHARRLLAAWLDDNPLRQVLVRLNGVQTHWHSADLELCRRANVAGVVLPKAERSKEIARVVQLTGKPVLPLIETPLGVKNVNDLAATLGVCRLLFGKLDLAVELNLCPDESDPDELMFLPYRASLVLASALAGIAPPVDGVFTLVDDAEGMLRYALRSKQRGFTGILLIHPRQINVVKRVLEPSPEEVAWAERVMSLVSGGGSVFVLDGKMIDAPVIARAKRILGD